ncbi:MAG: DNA-binding protein [Bacteroidaceae bacterium]|nr:DNA-binding protein [Bacteroidaceae bacterium]
MEVITVDSEVYQQFSERLDRIEKYIERAANMEHSIGKALLMTTRDVMETLQISQSTLFRWRRDGKIQTIVMPSGELRFKFEEIYTALRCCQIRVQGCSKETTIKRMDEFKNTTITKNIRELTKE